MRWAILAALPAAALSLAVTGRGDYGAHLPDDSQPVIDALLHGNLRAAEHHQTLIGLTSILLRLPFAFLAHALGGGVMLSYRFGVFACAWVAGLVAIAVVRRARLGPVTAALIVGLVVVNPLTVDQMGGHPEELLGGALCVAAVLAAMDDRSVWAGVLLGLAVATKEWALLAVVPTLLVCQDRRQVLLLATTVAAPLSLALPLLDPAAFTRAAEQIGNTNIPDFRSWWWLVSDARELHTSAGRATLHTLPLGLTRTTLSWLPLAVALPFAWSYRRRRSDPSDALRLLALLLLLRCALDPEPYAYYALPSLMALMSWKGLEGRLSLAALLAMTLFWLGETEALSRSTLGVATICWLAGTVGLTGYLLRDELTPRSWGRRDLRALSAEASS